MLDTALTVQRFSRHIVIRDQFRNGVPIYQSVHLLQDLMPLLIADNKGGSIEFWSYLFLNSLLRAPMVQAIFIRHGLHSNGQGMSSKGANRSSPSIHSRRAFNTVLNRIQALLCLHYNLCHRLLFCYLQPLCWQASLRVSQQLKRSPNTALHYPHLDCFAIACYHSTRPDALLRRFDVNANTSLDGYAVGALQKATKNQIAQELKSKSIKFSNYGLLRQVSQRRMERSLTTYGISATEQQQYLLVWTLFKNWAHDMGASGRFRVSRSLTTKQAEAIANVCKQRCKQLQLSLSLSAQQIQSILETCIKALQLEDGKRTTSLDALTHEVNPSAQAFDHGSDYAAPMMEPMMAQEQQAAVMEVRQTIQTALDTLDAQARQALVLWLGLGLNQTDFIPLLQVKSQYQVARQFQRYQRTVLKVTMQAYQQMNPDANLTDEVISERCKTQLAIVKEYLEQYSQRLFAEQLEELVRGETSGGDRSSLLAFTAELAERSPTNRQTTPMSEAARRLKQQFKRKIENQFSLPLDQFPSLNARMDDFIKSWLVNHQALLY